jgi:hypothetical protein
MKTLVQILIYAILGFVSATLVLKSFSFDLTLYAYPAVIGIFVIILIMLLRSMVIYGKIKKLKGKDIHGDEEDEVDILIYKIFTDYSFFTSTSTTLSVLALCISLITNQPLSITVLSIVAIVASYIFSMSISILLPVVYPDRNLPGFSEKNYAEKPLEVSDEGERHVMHIGLYKSYNVFTLALIIAILLATFYSISSGTSQLFSIIVMVIVLLLGHGKYCLAIRNK